MFRVSPATRSYVATAPVDRRRSFHGLLGWVKEHWSVDPLSGHWFVFTHRRRNRLKILYWDGSGLWVCAKRLEQGRFAWLKGEQWTTPLRAEERTMLISGLETRPKGGWYRR